MTTYTVAEAAQILGTDRTRVLRRIQSGELAAERKGGGKTAPWLIPASALFDSGRSYQELIGQFVQEMADGTHWHKPMTPRAIEANLEGLANFWKHLGDGPALHLLTAENYSKARTVIGVEEGRDYYATKFIMLKAVKAFVKFNIRHGRLEQSVLDELATIKLVKRYEPLRRVLTAAQLKHLFEVNEAMRGGQRTDYDTRLMDAVLTLAARCGLRRAELLAVRPEDLDLKQRLLLVRNGKGMKDRRVGLSQRAAESLSAWNEMRLDGSTLLTMDNGRPLTWRLASKRLERLRKRASLDIDLHGLRRTFATLCAQAGMPLTQLQKVLGHSDIKTTMAYIQHDESEAVAWLQRL